MIVAGPDGFEKGEYRKFNIKSTELTPGDDYGMMREVLTRRFARLVKESESDDAKAEMARPRADRRRPGPAQPSPKVLADLGVEDVLLVGISKGPDRDAGREHFYMHGPRTVPPRSQKPGALLPAAPARRGAPLRHRQPPQEARAKPSAPIPLDEIAGVGAVRKRALLQHFGSARAVAGASLADLEAVEGVSEALAKKIYDFFHVSG